MSNRKRGHVPGTTNPGDHACMPQMIGTLTDVCWDKCISSPGNYLSSKENSCLENCAKRFIETTQFIMQRAAHKAGEASSGGGLFQ